MARAKRIEEIPLLQEQFEEDQKTRREFWEHQENERVNMSRLFLVFASMLSKKPFICIVTNNLYLNNDNH